MFKSKIVLIFFIATSLFSNEVEEKKIIEVGMAASSLLKSTLTGKMKKVLKSKNKIELVQFCATQAQKITKGVNELLPKGIEVKRVSLKNRSDKNLPSKIDESIIRNLEKEFDKNKNDKQYILKKVDTGYKLYRPITLKDGCLKCHGKKETMDKNIKAKIEKLYPKDKAYGFLKEDFRGAFIVNIDKNVYK